jgi:hypothetical protein
LGCDFYKARACGFDQHILACYAPGVTVLGKELGKLMIRKINVFARGRQVAKLVFGFVLI